MNGNIDRTGLCISVRCYDVLPVATLHMQGPLWPIANILDNGVLSHHDICQTVRLGVG